MGVEMATTVRDVFTELAPPLSDEDALLAADRCLECGGPYAPAPCVVACPADVDVPGFVGAIARGEAERAAEVVWQENLLGGSCARVCPTEVLCAGACVLLHEGRDAVEIGRLQRYATDKGLAAGVPLRPAAERRSGRAVVLGAGPAGLACAGELAARGIEVTVVDERDEVGGLVRFAIAPYRQQSEPLPAEAAALEELGVRFQLGTAIDSAAKLRELELQADAIFLGVGMGADADVSYPGDELEGVWESLPFIQALKTGNPPDVAGKQVAVIGGGNTAVDVAIESIRLGAQSVTMVYRRTEAEMPAYPHEVEQARDEGCAFLFLANPVKFVGAKRVVGVECVEMRLGDPDESGRRRPEAVPESEFLVEADVVVKAIGQQPRAELLSWVDGLELSGGRLVVDEHGRTGNPKYFAAGDAINGGATVVEAVRGAKAAAAAIAEGMSS